ncbi:MAG TPA: M48 family metallopeptidase [Syntrophales bacterium]|nr:M48 family metallopeptidase [Syntrophales bacterium]HOX93379.1 M48 family metallopeptidase [Syntrophales bacterium]HPI56076.1 M48 family metallopeptidase [Syntrophales bacterium]HPN24034.1 M48 family metallopeptidase [Syntrophales bacterium]HQM28313.1 M48 family metallopeptidase [Syntrophales bacterium]
MIQWNFVFISFLIVFLAGSAIRWFLAWVNINHLQKHGHIVPDEFRGEIDAQTLSRMTQYTIASSAFASLESLFNDAVLLVVLFAGLFPWLAGVVAAWDPHPIWAGLYFFILLYLADVILDIPFNLYGTFVIEKKFGFSTMTPRLWLTDLFKNLVLSVILLSLLMIPVLALIEHAGPSWWIWAWSFFALFQFLVIWLYPIVIAPLFNKYEPVRNEDLRARILEMMERAGLRASGIYQVDAGKRSRHSNAYFTGIGKTKRIVLYDTLLGTHTPEEIVSILAHEIGHWKKKHVLKQLLLIGVTSLIVFYLIAWMIEWPLIYRTFGFQERIPSAGILLTAILLKPAAYFLAPIGAMISRRFERASDRYTFELIGSTVALCNALKRLAKDNLSNLHPHPLYAWFYYSHPPLTERIRQLRTMEASKDA